MGLLFLQDISQHKTLQEIVETNMRTDIGIRILSSSYSPWILNCGWVQPTETLCNKRKFYDQPNTFILLPSLHYYTRQDVLHRWWKGPLVESGLGYWPLTQLECEFDWLFQFHLTHWRRQLNVSNVECMDIHIQ